MTAAQLARGPFRWPLLTLAAAAAGLIALLPLPSVARLVLVVVLVGFGPGGAVRSWVPMAPSLTAVVVPALGIAAVVLGATAGALVAWWQPATLLVVVAALAAAAALARVVVLRADAEAVIRP